MSTTHRTIVPPSLGSPYEQAANDLLGYACDRLRQALDDRDRLASGGLVPADVELPA